METLTVLVVARERNVGVCRAPNMVITVCQYRRRQQLRTAITTATGAPGWAMASYTLGSSRINLQSGNGHKEHYRHKSTYQGESLKNICRGRRDKLSIGGEAEVGNERVAFWVVDDGKRGRN